MIIKSKSVNEKILKIKAILFDVDGVLTDGGIILDNNGNEFKRFNVKDGQIISYLRAEGILVGAITGRKSKLVEKRMRELNVDFLAQGVSEKALEFNNFLIQYSLDKSEVAFLGDDVIDLPVLSQCGLSVCPADAREYIKSRVDIITSSKSKGN